MIIDVQFRSVIIYPSGATAITTIERLARRGMFSAKSFVRYEVHNKMGQRIYERIEEVGCSAGRRWIASSEQERIASNQ